MVVKMTTSWDDNRNTKLKSRKTIFKKENNERFQKKKNKNI